MTSATKSPYAGYRYPPEIISHVVWLYFRFPLSLRMVEEMLAARGIGVSHETVRRCVARMRRLGTRTPAQTCSGEPDVGRAPQLQHAVEHMDGDVHLSGPTLVRVRAQPIPDHALVPADGGLSS